MMQGLAIRRHHEKRTKRNVAKYELVRWRDCSKLTDKEKARIVGRMARTKAMCSCTMCGNSRRHFGEITRAEKVHLIMLNEVE